MRLERFEVQGPTTEDGTPLSVVQPNARVLLPLPAGAKAGDLLRRKRQQD